MPTFQFTLAHDVSAYGTVEVVATDLADAVEQVRSNLDDSGSVWADVCDIEWVSSYRFRVVDVYTVDDQDGMGRVPLVRNIPLSEHEDSIPLSAEEVLVSLTAARLTQE